MQATQVLPERYVPVLQVQLPELRVNCEVLQVVHTAAEVQAWQPGIEQATQLLPLA